MRGGSVVVGPLCAPIKTGCVFAETVDDHLAMEGVEGVLEVKTGDIPVLDPELSLDRPIDQPDHRLYPSLGIDAELRPRHHLPLHHLPYNRLERQAINQLSHRNRPNPSCHTHLLLLEQRSDPARTEHLDAGCVSADDGGGKGVEEGEDDGILGDDLKEGDSPTARTGGGFFVEGAKA